MIDFKTISRMPIKTILYKLLNCIVPISWLFILQESKNIQAKFYTKDNDPAQNSKKKIIFMCDGKIAHKGFADRLRGILTSYMIAKELGHDFKIYFTSPFDLTKVFLPNDIDWSISDDEISYNSKDSKAYVIYGGKGGPFLSNKKRILKKAFRKPYKQIHIYTNSPISLYANVYSTLFKELFIYNPAFELDLQKHIAILGSNYISISTRFGVSLGDFFDFCGKSLSEEDQKQLLIDCKVQIEKIHNDYPDKNILITSDSERFTNYIKQLDYTYSLDGERLHIDKTDCQDFEILKLSLIDWLLISRANTIFQIKSNAMFSGGFSQSASYIDNKPYKLIEF